jgi:acylphosphatase
VDDPASARIVVTGRVQGVGFRWSLAQVSEEHGVRGWVRNRPDGAVEALLQGPRSRVDEVIAWTRRGPPGALVTDAQVEMEPDAEPFPQFEIRT